MAALALSMAVASAPVLAADPTMDQIYQAANAGQLDRAQQMMDQVLKDHPDSSKAHYVQAELYAREHQISLARAELARAEQLKPGLPEISQRSVAELQTQLGLTPRGVERPNGLRTEAQTQTYFPWKTLVVLALVVLVFWGLFRRRSSYVSYPGGGAPGTPMGGPGYGPGYGPGGGYVGPGGGGIGSSVAGGLAGGLAAGAGIVAGEELAHHFLDGGQQPGGSVVPPANAGEWNDAPSNGDMGGNDFGANDPGSWDDGGGGGGDFGGGGGGGDDWT